MPKHDFSEEYYDDFDEESEFDPKQEQELLFFATGFIGDLKCLIHQYIEYFFKDKSFYCGGKIPKRMLNTDRNISIVANYDISRSVKRAYSSLENHEISSSSLGEVTGDIKLVSFILEELAKSGIPQQFAGGMLLMYLELVVGVDIGQ